MSLRSSIVAVALFLGLATLGAGAQTVGGVKLADRVDVNGTALVLNGAGIRQKLFVKVYVGSLYLTEKQSSAPAILASDTPRRMVMHFTYNVGRDSLVDAWKSGLKDNTPNAPAEVQQGFETLASWMEDVKEGSELVMTYVPGAGTTVEVNGKTKGTIVGKATADALLSTWIGPKPGPGEDFKKAILGQ